MLVRPRAFCILGSLSAALLCAQAFSQSASPPPRAPAPTARTLFQDETESSSGFFLIKSQDQALRSALALFVEEAKQETLAFVRERDPGSTKITIVANPNPATTAGPVFVSELLLLDDGKRRLQVTIRREEGLRRENLRQEVQKVILTAWAVKNANRISADREPLPPWLTHGLSQAMSWRREGQASANFDSVLRAGAWMTPAQLFKVNPAQLDTVGEGIFSATSCALVTALLAQPDGLTRLKQLMAASPAWQGTDEQLVNRFFPGITRGGVEQLEKWISLQLASLSRPSVFEPLSAQETAIAISGALQFHVPADAIDSVNKPRPRNFFRKLNPFRKRDETAEAKAPDPQAAEQAQQPAVRVLELEDFIAARVHPDTKSRLYLNASQQLELLDRRAHPLFHHSIGLFIGFLRDGAADNLRDPGPRLTALRNNIAQLVSRSAEVTSYLDYYGANLSGLEMETFDEFYRAAEQAKSRPPRTDPVSAALNSVEQEWARAAELLQRKKESLAITP